MSPSDEESQREILHELLKRTRQNKGIRQVELAKKLGVPQSFISKYESGDRRLDILELRKVCQALGISLEEFARELERNFHEAK